MDARTIGRQIAGMRRPRRVGLPGTGPSRPWALAGLACLFLGTSVLAQNTLDFVDPLDEERIRVERAAEPSEPSPADRWRPAVRAGSEGAASRPAGPVAAAPPAREDRDTLLLRARDEASAGTAALREDGASLWARMRGALSGIAAAIGLPLMGLVALLFLLLAGLAALIGWTLFRGHGKYNAPYEGDDDSDLYARTPRSTQKRRNAGEARATPAPNDDFEETMPEDFDAILAREQAERTQRAPAPVSAPEPADAPDPEDTATWRKPNLDRLRDSIKSDWKASRKPAPAPAPLPAETPAEDRRLSDISDGWDAWDAQEKPEDDLWGETLAPAEPASERSVDDEALRRIRALRQSLRAS